MPAKVGVDGTLYSYSNNPRAQLILIAAQYGGSNVTLASDFEFGVTNKTKDFTSKFPFGQVPAFECSAGNLYDSAAIASFVGSSELSGSDSFTRAQITQFSNLAETQLFPAACQVLYPCWGLMPNNKNVVSKGHDSLAHFMTSLDTLLEPRTYLVGEGVTLADLTLAVYLRDLYAMIFDEATRNKYVNVTRWFTTIINQDEVVRVLGQTSLCVKPAQFDAKLFSQNNPKQQKAPKKEAPKKAVQEKKEEKPAEPKKKEKVPFGDLPPPKLVLDTFKRLYWNQPTEEILAYFHENFVDGDWSVWTVDYKENANLKTPANVNSLMKGMMNRLDSMRKQAFGLMYTFGEAYNMEIHGIWLGRGGKNFFYEDENWNQDIENYHCTKLDMTKPEDAKLWERWIKGEMEDWNGKVFDKDFIF